MLQNGEGEEPEGTVLAVGLRDRAKEIVRLLHADGTIDEKDVGEHQIALATVLVRDQEVEDTPRSLHGAQLRHRHARVHHQLHVPISARRHQRLRYLKNPGKVSHPLLHTQRAFQQLFVVSSQHKGLLQVLACSLEIATVHHQTDELHVDRNARRRLL